MKDFVAYVAIIGAGLALGLWALLPKSLASTMALGAVGVAGVVAFFAVVLPRHRRNRWTHESRAPGLIVHAGGGDTQRTLRQRTSHREPGSDRGDDGVDIHGTG